MSKSSVTWLCGSGVGVIAVSCALLLMLWPSTASSPVMLFSAAVFVGGFGIGIGASRGQVRASRVVESKLQLDITRQLTECDTRELCAHAADAVAPLAARRGVALELDVGTRCLLLCDQARFEQAVTNLLGHAINQTPSDGVVSLYVDETEHNLEFAVHDTGPGIPAEELDAIFLWNAGAILDAHGATLAVENHAHGGTTFRFALPKIAADERRAPEASGQFKTATATSRAS